MSKLGMQALSPSPNEQVQDGSSRSAPSSPPTSAGPQKISEVNRTLSTLDDSRVSMESNQPRGSKKLDIANQEEHRDRLYTSLRALVSEVASQLRKSILDEVLDPDPISYRLPQDNDEINVSTIKTIPSSSVEAKTRAKTTLLGEETVSFVLPPDCVIGTHLYKNIQHQSSFEERLQGWHIACRGRANRKLDMSYRHGQSRRMFRSTVEVVQFIMEALIAKEMPGSSSLQEQGHATPNRGSLKKKESSSKKGKIPPSKSLKSSSTEQVAVECFLEESYNNLTNISVSRQAAPEREEWETYLNLSSENEDDASSDEQTR